MLCARGHVGEGEGDPGGGCAASGRGEASRVACVARGVVEGLLARCKGEEGVLVEHLLGDSAGELLDCAADVE